LDWDLFLKDSEDDFSLSESSTENEEADYLDLQLEEMVTKIIIWANDYARVYICVLLEWDHWNVMFHIHWIYKIMLKQEIWITNLNEL